MPFFLTIKVFWKYALQMKYLFYFCQTGKKNTNEKLNKYVKTLKQLIPK